MIDFVCFVNNVFGVDFFVSPKICCTESVFQTNVRVTLSYLLHTKNAPTATARCAATCAVSCFYIKPHSTSHCVVTEISEIRPYMTRDHKTSAVDTFVTTLLHHVCCGPNTPHSSFESVNIALPKSVVAYLLNAIQLRA